MGVLTSYNRIRLTTAPVVVSVRPGMLVQRDRHGSIKPHAIAGGEHLSLFVAPAEITNSHIEIYAPGSAAWLVSVKTRPSERSRVFAETMVLLRGGERVDIGTPLVSAGDGRLCSYRSVEDYVAVVAHASEAVDLTGQPDRLIPAEIWNSNV